jgi:hypothetical protein
VQVKNWNAEHVCRKVQAHRLEAIHIHIEDPTDDLPNLFQRFAASIEDFEFVIPGTVSLEVRVENCIDFERSQVTGSLVILRLSNDSRRARVLQFLLDEPEL